VEWSSVAADINLTTGQITRIANAINVFPITERGLPKFQYVELVTRPGDQHLYFHVTAYNSVGTGPPSVLVRRHRVSRLLTEFEGLTASERQAA
jgi:hypothetical protein